MLSVFVFAIGDNLGILRFPVGKHDSPLWAILWAPFRETIFLIFAVYLFRLCLQGFTFPAKFLSVLVIFTVGLMFGFAHASESLSPSHLWYFMRLGQSGLIFSGMALQWEAIREERGKIISFCGVMTSHSISNTVVLLYILFSALISKSS